MFCENPRIIFVLFYDVHKENMFTINLEDGREAAYKASIIYMITKNFLHFFDIFYLQRGLQRFVLRYILSFSPLFLFKKL